MHAGIHTYSGQSRGRGRENKLFPSPCLNFPFLALSTGSFYILLFLCLVSVLSTTTAALQEQAFFLPSLPPYFRGLKKWLGSTRNSAFSWWERQRCQPLVSLAFSTVGCGARDRRSLLLHYQDLLCNHKKKKEKQDNTREDLKGPSQCWHVITLRQNCASACPISSLICK